MTNTTTPVAPSGEHNLDHLEALAPCPFCGAADPAMHPNDLASCGRQMSNPHTDANYGHCDSCGADGPVGMTDPEARELWNRRAAPVSAPIAGDALHKLCEALIDIWDDAQENPPESRCYVEGSWPGIIKKVRAALANQPAPTAAPEQVAQVAALDESRIRRIGAGVYGFPIKSDDLQFAQECVTAALSQPSEAAPLDHGPFLLVPRISTLEMDNDGAAALPDDCSSIDAERCWNAMIAAWVGAPASCKPDAAPSLPAAAPAHPDDIAVDRFATAMKAKMAASRAKGRNGWEDPAQCPADRLRAMLVEHLAKGDPTDIGNFAMMLWNRGERTAAAPAAGDGLRIKQLEKALRPFAKLVPRFSENPTTDTVISEDGVKITVAHIMAAVRALAHQPAQDQADVIGHQRWSKEDEMVEGWLAAQHEAGDEIDVRYEFERWMSQRGESAEYIGDGLYSTGAVCDQAKAFAGGVEVARAASPVVRAQSEESRPRRELPPGAKEAIAAAHATGSTVAELPDGSPIFINYGHDYGDSAHLECTACGGSGHRDAQQAHAGADEAKPLAHGHRDDYYLMANARRLAHAPITRIQRMPNWQLASELFATGSNSAHQICHDAGIDPNACTIERAAIRAAQEGGAA